MARRTPGAGDHRDVLVPFRRLDHTAFRHPDEVVEAGGLAGAEKRRILLDWLQDEIALLVADDEGMLAWRTPADERVRPALVALARLDG